MADTGGPLNVETNSRESVFVLVEERFVLDVHHVSRLIILADAMTEAEVRAVLEKEEEEEARVAGDLDLGKGKGRNSSVTVFIRLGLYLEDLQCVFLIRVRFPTNNCQT